jgi:hypothetical protein
MLDQRRRVIHWRRAVVALFVGIALLTSLACDDDEQSPDGPASETPASGTPANAAPDMRIVVDVDASAAGIQETRTTAVDETFRVAIVATNVAADVASFNFFVDYDRRLAIAPSHTAGASTDRNPDLDESSMGDGWSCLPDPEGDVDDPGGIGGDGDPETGRALLSCFNTTRSVTGTIVLGILELRAVAGGELALTPNGVALGSPGGEIVAQCEGIAAVPCVAATVTIRS